MHWLLQPRARDYFQVDRMIGKCWRLNLATEEEEVVKGRTNNTCCSFMWDGSKLSELFE